MFRKRNKKSYKMSRTDADIMAGKQIIIDHKLGYETVVKTYDEISDKLCGKPNRGGR